MLKGVRGSKVRIEVLLGRKSSEKTSEEGH